MTKSEIKVGGRYLAKVSGKLTTVRVDAIEEHVQQGTRASGSVYRTIYRVTNEVTGRKTFFRSAQKFRKELKTATA